MEEDFNEYLKIFLYDIKYINFCDSINIKYDLRILNPTLSITKIYEKICKYKDYENFINNVDWKFLSAKEVLTIDFSREYIDKLDWKIISSRSMLSQSFIFEYRDKFDWNIISSKLLTESIIKKYIDKILYRLSTHRLGRLS